ncbi:MAG: hypothetical protein LBT23_10935 [Synergistaceae bacterium]|jgi:acyl-ACP thioesterase|nr:hypothetical protein [Synergistaceae bacterium]
MFERNFTIPYYGLDMYNRVKPGVLLQFFQETAALHAGTVNIGVDDLMKRDLTWVLRRYRVNVNRYPGRGELLVRTWFEPQRNLLSVRMFEVKDADGNVIASAWSSWIVVDLKKGRPVRLDRALPDAYFKVSEPTGEPISGDVPGIEGEPDFERRFDARRSELDLNGHTNHTVYFEWALESIPDEEIAGFYPTTFDAEFLVSVKREQVSAVTKKTGENPLRYSHSILINETGALSARLETVWEIARPICFCGRG